MSNENLQTSEDESKSSDAYYSDDSDLEEDEVDLSFLDGEE